MAIKFAQTDELKRERDIEGEKGVWMRLTDSIFLHVVCQSDANPRARTHWARLMREIRRVQNTEATPEEIDAAWASMLWTVVVLGWRGVVDEGGNAIEFNRSNWMAWTEQHPRVIKMVDKFSEDETNFRSRRDQKTIDQLNFSSAGS